MALFKVIIPFLAVFHFTLLHFNSIKLGLLYFTSLHLLIIKAVFEESLYFKCIFEFRSLPPCPPFMMGTELARGHRLFLEPIHFPSQIAHVTQYMRGITTGHDPGSCSQNSRKLTLYQLRVCTRYIRGGERWTPWRRSGGVPLLPPSQRAYSS